MIHVFKILLVDVTITVADICSDFFMGEQKYGTSGKNSSRTSSSCHVFVKNTANKRDKH
jgi:hypothetical protein